MTGAPRRQWLTLWVRSCEVSGEAYWPVPPLGDLERHVRRQVNDPMRIASVRALSRASCRLVGRAAQTLWGGRDPGGGTLAGSVAGDPRRPAFRQRRSRLWGGVDRAVAANSRLPLRPERLALVISIGLVACSGLRCRRCWTTPAAPRTAASAPAPLAGAHATLIRAPAAIPRGGLGVFEPAAPAPSPASNVAVGNSFDPKRVRPQAAACGREQFMLVSRPRRRWCCPRRRPARRRPAPAAPAPR